MAACQMRYRKCKNSYSRSQETLTSLDRPAPASWRAQLAEQKPVADQRADLPFAAFLLHRDLGRRFLAVGVDEKRPRAFYAHAEHLDFGHGVQRFPWDPADHRLHGVGAT